MVPLLYNILRIVKQQTWVINEYILRRESVDEFKHRAILVTIDVVLRQSHITLRVSGVVQVPGCDRSSGDGHLRHQHN